MSELKAKAQKLLEQRLAVLDGLDEARARVDAARAELAAAEAASSSAWDAAVAGGWAEAELRRLGVSEPARKRGGRPRGTTRKRSIAAPAQDRAEGQDDASDHAGHDDAGHGQDGQ